MDLFKPTASISREPVKYHYKTLYAVCQRILSQNPKQILLFRLKWIMNTPAHRYFFWTGQAIFFLHHLDWVYNYQTLTRPMNTQDKAMPVTLNMVMLNWGKDHHPQKARIYPAPSTCQVQAQIWIEEIKVWLVLESTLLLKSTQVEVNS